MHFARIRAIFTGNRHKAPKPARKHKPAPQHDPFGPGVTRESLTALFPQVGFGPTKRRPGID